MRKRIALGVSAAVVSFMIAGGVALAQSPSVSPTATASPSPSASSVVPSAAPATGFGGN